MAVFRTRPLGHAWSRITLPDGRDESEQLLSLFSDALATVPELSYLPKDIAAYEVIWDRRRVTIYHVSEEAQPVFRAEPLR